MKEDANMAIPKYEMIKQDLLQEIRDHKFIPGEKFYSEAELKNRYSVSSITVVKALNELTLEGYLFRIQGKGTFVSKAKVGTNVKFSDIENHSVDSEHVEVLSVIEENDPTILKELNLTAKDSYVTVTRVRYSNDVPFLIHHSHLPRKLIQTNLENLEAFSSVSERVHLDSGVNLFNQSSVETNDIIFPDDPSILNQLRLSFREPVVEQIKTTYLDSNEVAEYTVSYKHWKFYKIKIEVEHKKQRLGQ